MIVEVLVIIAIVLLVLGFLELSVALMYSHKREQKSVLSKEWRIIGERETAHANRSFYMLSMMCIALFLALAAFIAIQVGMI